MWNLWPFLVSRQAKSAARGRHIALTLLQTAAMWAFFFFLAPWIIVRLETGLGLGRFLFHIPGMRIAASIAFVLCGVLGITSGVLMAIHGQGTPLPATCPARLAIVGPYRYVRNPMAMASLAQGLCVGVWLGSPLVLGYVFVGGLLWNFVARPWEETDLEQRFGEPYRNYCRAVRCWIPRLVPYQSVQTAYAAIESQQTSVSGP